jgi:hypothetical protein
MLHHPFLKNPSAKEIFFLISFVPTSPPYSYQTYIPVLTTLKALFLAIGFEAYPSIGVREHFRAAAGARELVTQYRYRFITDVLGSKDNVLLVGIQEIWDYT